MSNVAAGWYPSPEDPTQNRFWDGGRWTEHVAPIAVPEPVTAAAPQFSPPPAPGAAAFSAPAPGAPKPPASSKRKWLIGGAIAAGVIVVGSVGAAIGSGGRSETASEASTAPVVSVPSPTPEEVVETPPPAPVVETVDAVGFRAQAGSHLDDMLKDLDDIVTTVNEDGFWRLLSNSGELAFNQGQLQALDVPENVAATWPASLAALEATQDSLTDAIGTQDGPTILAAVEIVRAQVEASRGVANTAQ